MALAERLLGGRLRVADQVLNAMELREVLDSVKASTYFGKNHSSHDFYRGTRGFSLVFRKPWRHQLEEHFPYLRTLLQRTLHAECNCCWGTKDMKIISDRHEELRASLSCVC